MVCLLLLSLTLAATYFLGHRGYGDRYPGFFKHPNQLGPIASMAAIYFFCQLLVSSRRIMLYNLVCLLVAVYTIFLTGSKTNLIGFSGLCLVAVPLLAFQITNTQRAIAEVYKNSIMAFGAIVLGVVLLPIVNARAYTVLDSILAGNEEVNQYGSVVARTELWQESWNMALAYPLTGVGAGQLMSDGTEHSHNVFMDAMRTTGFPGLGITAAFILAVLWYFLGAYAAARGLSRNPASRLSQEEARGPFIGSLMTLISYLVSNQMSDSFGPSTIPFFYMFLAFSFTYFLPRSSSGAGELATIHQKV
jgi:O-antigen ligase